MKERREFRKKILKEDFADSRRNYRLRTRLSKALDIANPDLPQEHHEQIADALEIAANATLTCDTSEIQSYYEAILIIVTEECDIYREALEKIVRICDDFGDNTAPCDAMRAIAEQALR